MNVSTLLNLTSEFTSSFESIESIDLTGQYRSSISCANTELINNITGESWGINLNVNSIKNLFIYLLGMHSLEPIFSTLNHTMSLSNLQADNTYNYDDFYKITTVDDKFTFRFKPIVFTDEMLLNYRDLAYLGENSKYRPFGHTSDKALDTKITCNVAEIRQFFSQNFKYKNIRGKANFSSLIYYKKGTVIFLADKNIYLIISSITMANAIINYEALVVVKV